MSIVDSIAAVAKPWADFYSHSKPTSVGITWVHIAALVVGGGLAIASDRAALRIRDAGIDDRRRLLAAYGSIHRPVLTALTVSAMSGVAMMLSDVATFLVSPVYWTKMGVIAVLLLNGYGIQLTERKLTLDPSPTNRLWKRFSFGAVASIALWLGTALAGVMLMND